MAMDDKSYPQQFFDYHEEGSRKSARATIPFVLDLVRPASVVDVGCGIGTWLAEFQAAGISDYLGVDGDYVDRAALVIEPERFVAHDLGEPLDLGRRFDLAMSLEVAEHLPDEAAEPFVASLTALAPVVLFSAAIPYQGGNGHVNEQWPEYWQEIFARHQYVVVDCLRERIWRHKDVKPWYAQNLLFFVERDRLSEYPRLASCFQQAGETPRLSLVHPDHYLLLHQHTLKQLDKAQRVALRASVNLRDINFIAFPDWTLPQNLLVDQLRGLLSAVLTHPQGMNIAMLIYFAGDSAGSLLSHVAKEILAPGGVPIAAAPAISGLSQSFGADQWRILLPCLQARIVLPNEDTHAIAAVSAESIPALPLGVLQSKQPLTLK
jgi:SAM-dependent methyltransferase